MTYNKFSNFLLKTLASFKNFTLLCSRAQSYAVCG